MGMFVVHYDEKRALNRIFFVYCLVSSVYSFSEFGYLQAESYQTAHFWLKVRSVWVFTFALALHFHFLFTERESWKKVSFKTISIYLIPIVIYIADVFTYQVTGTPILVGDIWTYDPPANSLLYHFGGAFAVSYILFMSGLTLNYFIKSKDILKHDQARFLLIADILVIVVVLLNTFVIKTPAFQGLHLDSVLLLGSNVVIFLAIRRTYLMRLTPEKASMDILSTIPNILVLVNPTGKISTVNPATLAMSGYKLEELENQPVNWLFSGRKLKKEVNLEDHFSWDREIIQDEEQLMRHKSGRFKPVLLSVSKVGTGKETGFVVLGYDATETQRTEVQLLQYATILEKSNAVLTHFQKAISHDLSESARLMSIFAQLIKKEDTNLHGKNSQYIDFIIDEGKKIYQKIRNLLNYTEIHAESQKELLDFNALVREVISDYNEFSIRINTQITIDRLPILHADKTQMTLLFKNLIANALTYRKEDSLEISLSAEEKQDGTWEFAMKDNGIGIDAKYQDKVFLLFHQSPNNKVHSGQGIGLALCKKIVEEHGGEIWVESQENLGATFYFTLSAN